MNLTNIEAMQIFIRLYNTVHSVETDEFATFYADRFIEVLNELFTEDEINDLLSLAQGFSLRQVAKASARKISHVSMKKFEFDSAISVNEEMYRRHYLRSESDANYTFQQSSEYQLSKIKEISDNYSHLELSALVRSIRICVDYDARIFDDLKTFFTDRKDLLKKFRSEMRILFPSTMREIKEKSRTEIRLDLEDLSYDLEKIFEAEKS